MLLVRLIVFSVVDFVLAVMCKLVWFLLCLLAWLELLYGCVLVVWISCSLFDFAFVYWQFGWLFACYLRLWVLV